MACDEVSRGRVPVAVGPEVGVEADERLLDGPGSSLPQSTLYTAPAVLRALSSEVMRSKPLSSFKGPLDFAPHRQHTLTHAQRGRHDTLQLQQSLCIVLAQLRRARTVCSRR